MDTYIKILPSNGLITNCGVDPFGAAPPADIPFANTLGYILLKVGSFQPKLYQVPGGEEPGYVQIEFPGYKLEMQITGCLPGEITTPFTDKSKDLYDEIMEAMTPNPGNGGIVTLTTRAFVQDNAMAANLAAAAEAAEKGAENEMEEEGPFEGASES
mgnify:CR=1 FL=1